MQQYRTDLAIECREILDEQEQRQHTGRSRRRGEPDGIQMEKIEYDGGIHVTRIKIATQEAAEKMGKPIGNYITLEADGVLEEEDGIQEKAAKAVAGELGQLLHVDYSLKVLVAGLGTSLVTPDRWGPETAAKVRVTRHLFLIFDADGDEEMSNVSCIIPGVTGSTGMETAEVIKKAAEIVQPDVVIVIDSLAARDIERVSTTIQLTDTGIQPGSGMGNHRNGINEETIGAPVLAIGVPTVIDIKTILREALEENLDSAEAVETYLRDYDRQMIVTSTDIDLLVKDFSDIIAGGINKVLHPGIYS